MHNVQNLKKLSRYDVITNGISYERILGYINVIIAYDDTEKENFKLNKQAINEIISLFDTRKARFNLLSFNYNVRLKYLNRKLPRGINRIKKYNRKYIKHSRFGRNPNVSKMLRYVYRNLLRRSFMRSRQTILVVVMANPSSSNPSYYSELIKNKGVTIATVGLGHRFNEPELLQLASLFELGFTCNYPIIQNCLIRFETAFIQRIHFIY